MAVIIENMDMPKSCEECYFHHSPSYHMWVCPNGCPLKEVPTGKWLHKQTDSFYHVIGQCSNCKNRYRINNYCPNCGAKMMVEEQQGEDTDGKC